MNAARATENASVDEDPTPRPDGRAPVTDEDVDAEHIRAVWEMAALTALDGIRDAPGSEASPASGHAVPKAPGREAPPASGAWATGPVAGAPGTAGRPDAPGPHAPGLDALGPHAPDSDDSVLHAPGPDATGSDDSGSDAPGSDATGSEDSGPHAPGPDALAGVAVGGNPVGREAEALAGPDVWGEPDTGTGPGEGPPSPGSADVPERGGPGGRGDAPQAGGSAEGSRSDEGRAVSSSGAPDGWGGPGAGTADGEAGASLAGGDGGGRLTDRFRSRDADAAPVRKAARRGGGDPVKGLLHQHRELCEQAVDAFEIAAGLEAHGLTDRTAARYRHRDVFSLAEEMSARAGRTAVTAPPAPAPGPRPGLPGVPPRVAAPGVVCALALAAVAVTDGGQRLAAGAAGALATALALLHALRRGPLRARGRRAPGAARLWTLWLLGYAVCGPGLIGEIAGGGPEGAVPLSSAPLLVTAVAVVPAAWCARLFAVRAARRIRTSRGLDEFAAGVRPLLLAVVALFTAVLAALALLTGPLLPGADGAAAPVVALGALFFLARLLIVHGFPGPASAALAAACAVEAAVPALLLAGRLPGLDLLARPAELLVRLGGTAAAPVLACAGAALALLATACTVLVRASAHTP